MFCMIGLSHFGKDFNSNLRLGSIEIDVIINVYVIYKGFISLGIVLDNILRFLFKGDDLNTWMYIQGLAQGLLLLL